MRPVLQYSDKGILIERYNSIKDAACAVSCSVSAIGQVCNKRKGKKTAKGYIWRFETEKDPFEEEEGEEWKNLPDIQGYKVSSKGRVYSIKTKRYLSFTKRKDGYLRVCPGGIHHYVHRIVALTFFGNPPDNLISPVVNHKDGNKSNNIAENLEWIEFKDNISHAHDTGLNSTCKPVIRYSLKGIQISTYKSVADAARDAGVSHTAILDACNKKKHVYTIVDCLWRYTSDPLQLSELKDIKRLKRSVVKYSLSGEQLQTYSSMSEAAKNVNVHPSAISDACRKKIKTAAGYVWRYQGESCPTENVKVGCVMKVEQLTKQGEIIKVWISISDAAKILNIASTHISSVCKGKRKTSGGYVWKYAN
uniref:HNH endonuclease n=1 Tax=Marseillevirus LCMAC102 TaxID=2506603 RepID=A0A481YTV2_9VIRU|nr:MAG: HNH endonuclease [Marseillevirus LCMAC102]